MCAVLLSAALFLLPTGAPARTQVEELQARLSTRVSQYGLSAEGLADALARVSVQFRLPMGIEWIRDSATLAAFSRTWKDKTVRDVLGSIIARYPGYSFRVEEGVVHVFPQDFVADKRNFLNLKVPDSFHVRQEVGGLANQRLRGIVQNIVSPRNLPPRAGEGGEYSTGIDETPLTLRLEGLSIRDALDSLVVSSEHKIWVVTFSESPALTPTGFRRTETLWHPTPFPNSDQPMWDFIAWKDYAPKSASPRR